MAAEAKPAVVRALFAEGGAADGKATSVKGSRSTSDMAQPESPSEGLVPLTRGSTKEMAQHGVQGVTAASHILSWEVLQEHLPFVKRESLELWRKVIDGDIANLPIKGEEENTPRKWDPDYGKGKDDHSIDVANIEAHRKGILVTDQAGIQRIKLQIAIAVDFGGQVPDDELRALLMSITEQLPLNSSTASKSQVYLGPDGNPTRSPLDKYPTVYGPDRQPYPLYKGMSRVETGLCDDGVTPDKRTKAGQYRDQYDLTREQNTGRKLDNTASKRSKIGIELGIPESEEPAKVTGEKLNGEPHMGTIRGRMIAAQRAEAKAKKASELAAVALRDSTSAKPAKDPVATSINPAPSEFHGSDRYAWSGETTGPLTKAGLPDMRFKVNRTDTESVHATQPALNASTVTKATEYSEQQARRDRAAVEQRHEQERISRELQDRQQREAKGRVEREARALQEQARELQARQQREASERQARELQARQHREASERQARELAQQQARRNQEAQQHYQAAPSYYQASPSYTPAYAPSPSLSGFSGSACYAWNGNTSGPTTSAGLPDMRYSCNRK